MVDGLKHFLAHFTGFESHFILIGGTACDLWMRLRAFLESLPPTSLDWKDIQAAVQGLPEPEQVIAQIRANFDIGDAA